MAEYQVKPLRPEQRPALAQFYKLNHYKGKIKATDNVWLITRDDDQIIGAARLCQQGGLTLLRGVWIERALRTQGLGSQLLQHLQCAGVLEGCYCFAFLHLEAFYSTYGFCRVASVPASLHSALERYNRPAVKVLLMVQQA